MDEKNDYYLYEQVSLNIKNFETDGYVLDIGGGGEGVIGKLKGRDVVAIDIRKDELEETPEGPLKVIMDARDLKFLDNSFNTATAFFSLMYIKSQEDQKQIFEEVSRVLKPGGYFHVWDVNLAERPDTDKDLFIVFIRYLVGDKENGTGYGNRFPLHARGEDYYIAIAESVGFKHIKSEENLHTFYLLFQKRT